MVDQLLDYINKARVGGQSDEQIKDALLQAGWQESAIRDALAGKVLVSPQPIVAGQRIKCAHCGYIGPAQSGRSKWAQILAWVAIIVTPIITIAYYLLTNPWLCGQCGSKLVEEIDEQGRVKKRSKALLIVLLVAFFVVPVVIIGFLASIVLVSMGGAREQAKDARRMADLRQTQMALELYYDKYNAYPSGAGTFQSTLNVLVTERFFGSLPQEPSPGFRPYFYCASADQKNYVVGAALENEKNTKRTEDLDGDQYCASGSGACDDPVYCRGSKTQY